MQSIARTLPESSYDFMMTLLIYTDADIIILSGQGFSYKNTLSLLSDQLRHIFDNLYWARIMGRYKFGSSTMDKTAIILSGTIYSYDVIVELSKHEIKGHTSITSTLVHFLVIAKISDPIQDIYQMKRDIKMLSTKSDRHHGRMAKLKE